MIALKSHVDSVVAGARHVPGLVSSCDQVSGAMADIVTCVQRHQDNIQTMARDLSVSIAHTYIAALLLDHAITTRYNDTVYMNAILLYHISRKRHGNIFIQILKPYWFKASLN